MVKGVVRGCVNMVKGARVACVDMSSMCRHGYRSRSRGDRETERQRDRERKRCRETENARGAGRTVQCASFKRRQAYIQKRPLEERLSYPRHTTDSRKTT